MALEEKRLGEIAVAASVQSLLGEATLLTPSQLKRMLKEKLGGPALRKMGLTLEEAHDFYERIFREAVDLMFAPPSKGDDSEQRKGH